MIKKHVEMMAMDVQAFCKAFRPVELHAQREDYLRSSCTHWLLQFTSTVLTKWTIDIRTTSSVSTGSTTMQLFLAEL